MKQFLSQHLWYFIWMLLLVGGYIICSLRMVQYNERAVKVFLGRARRKVIFPGLRWVWFPFEWLLRYPTTEVELDYEQTIQVTTSKGQPGSAFAEFGYGTVTLHRPSVYFYWPVPHNPGDPMDDLFRAIENMPSPQDQEGLRDLFQEPLFNAIRSHGSRVTWMELNQDINGFASNLASWLIDGVLNPLSPFVQAGVNRVRVAFTDLTFSEKLRDAIDGTEQARLLKQAAILTAEGRKRTLELEGEGEAAARKSVYAAIGNTKTALIKELFLTLRQMTSNPGKTIWGIIPPQMAGMFSNIFGPAGPSDEQFRGIVRAIEDMLVQKGALPRRNGGAENQNQEKPRRR